MSDHQVIIITNGEEHVRVEDKVLLFDPKEGRASKRQLCIFALAWILMSLTAPLWMASIVERPYTITVPPPAQTGLIVTPSSECVNLDDCGTFAISFNVTLRAQLDYAPTTAYPPVLFASVSHPNDQWWVAGVAHTPLSQLDQEWTISGGCFGAPGGRLYLVACLPAEGQKFVQGDHVRGAPFDDRCTAIGTWCGGSCSEVLNPLYCNASNHQITSLPNGQSGNIIANNATLPAGSYTFSDRSNGMMATIFVFFTVLSFVTFLMNHCAPVVACLQQIGKNEGEALRTEYPSLDKIKYKNRELAVAVVSVFCYEKAFHITRNLIGVACSWNALAKVANELGYKNTRVVHYVVDNSSSKSDCLPSLLEKFVDYCNEHSDTDWETVMRGLQDAPFEPTKEEYVAMLPFGLREVVDSFLEELSGEDRPIFDPFTKDKSDKLAKKASENAVPQLVAMIKITVDVEVVRLPSGNRSKVKALQECGKRFQGFKKEADGFLAIMDARHMMTPAFWQYSLPAFFVQGSKLGVIPHNEENGERGQEEYFENTSMRLAQVMQHFPVVHTTDDYFDRGNFFNYLYSNALRNQVQSVSSCGTNALWSMRDTPAGGKFNFSGKTLIEDTETSHAFMERGETSTYISRGLVHGSVKNPEDYGEAPSRWAAGAIQLVFRQPSALQFILSSLFFYAVLPVVVSLIVTCVRHGEWVLLVAWCGAAMFALVWVFTSTHKRRVAQAVIRMVNTTYWFTGPLTAVFWMLFVPACILFSGELPFQFNAEAMMAGGLLMGVLQWVMVVLAKKWAKAEEMHLWRSQQAWFALWPLNFLGIPRLLNPNTSWQISTIQAKVTLGVNISEVLLLCASLLYSLFHVRERMDSAAGAATLLVGGFSAIYSLALLFPTTSYLFNSLLFHKRHPYNTSSRHILGVFLMLCLFVYLAYSPNWTIAFSQFFRLATPTWYFP